MPITWQRSSVLWNWDPQSALEKAEKLEMLRLLETDIDIYVELTESSATGVDHPDDLPKVIALMER